MTVCSDILSPIQAESSLVCMHTILLCKPERSSLFLAGDCGVGQRSHSHRPFVRTLLFSFSIPAFRSGETWPQLGHIR